MDITKFNEKLNKVDGQIYVMEEVVTPNDGVYEGELAHDNVNITTLNIYTGTKLTGDKINTYTTSTPSLTPWKTVIKIYSNVTPLYISYETSGDTVEAEDINNVQDAIVDTEKALNNEIDRANNKENIINNDLILYKTTNNAEIQGLKAKDVDLDNKKSNLDYVNTEFGKRYTKDLVFTKDEVLQKIKDLIGTAPQTLDTFKEIADALGNDPNFATTIMNALAQKVDKVAGKQLSINDYDNTEKATLADVNSKKHTHSNKSIIDTITQALLDMWNSAYSHISDTVKHITSTERSNWNTAYNNNHIHGNKTVIDTITQALIDTWNSAYAHINDNIKHISNTERTSWNNGVTTANSANSKIDGLQIGGRNYFINSKRNISYGGGLTYQAIEPNCPYGFYAVGDQDATNWLRISNVIKSNGYWTVSWEMRGSQNCAVKLEVDICDTNHTTFYTTTDNSWKKFSLTVNVTNYGDGSTYNFVDFENFAWAYFYIRNIKVEEGNKPTSWTSAPEDIQEQLNGKSDLGHTHDDRYYTETESDNKFATKNEISVAGYGDMLKSVYDTNGDGVVDNADKLDGKHAGDFALSDHIHPKFSYDSTFTTGGTKGTGNYVWVRIPYGDQNGGDKPLRIIITRSIFDNSKEPYGGCTFDCVFTGHNWHSGYLGGYYLYTEHGGASYGQFISNVDVYDYQNNNSIYLKMLAGLTYRIAVFYESGIIATSDINTNATDYTGDGYAVKIGLNTIGMGMWINGNEVLSKKQGITWNDLEGV